ncbi:MAG: metallophosphoesterase [Actinomycetota bacterium]
MRRTLVIGPAILTLVVLGACSGAAGTSGSAQQTPSPNATASSSVDPSETAATPSPTAPSVEPDLTLAVLGDFGAANEAQQDVADRMCRYRRNHPFDHVVTTGDNIYPDGHPARFESAFFEPYRCLMDEGVDFHATLGNHDIVHDGGRSELSEPAFGLPRRNYVFRRLGLRLVLANSNALNYDWLKEATRARAADRWTIVAFHHPVFSAGPHGSTPGFRPSLPRLFRRRGVDLVLNGHDHLYLATKELRGIRYVVTGGGGATLYACEPRWFVEFCISRHHFLYIVLFADRIEVRALPVKGRAFHKFSTDGG